MCACMCVGVYVCAGVFAQVCLCRCVCAYVFVHMCLCRCVLCVNVCGNSSVRPGFS